MTGFEVVLPRRVVPQPTPELNRGGDCGACVLGGLLGMTLAEVYDQLRPEAAWNGERYTGGKVESFSWWDMARALGLCGGRQLDRYDTEVPIWPENKGMLAWGLTSTMQVLGWWHRLVMACDAGYYAIAQVDSQRRGLSVQTHDHWVLVCGVREVHPEGTGRVRTELLVSNSSRSAPALEWVERNDFLGRWGGFNLMLARPRA